MLYMINIVTKKPKHNFVNGIDAEFNFYINGKDLDNERCASVMKKIDSAKMVDSNTEIISTPYGATTIQHLSTGCKVVLLYIVNNSNDVYKCLNIVQAGPNALDVLFDCVEENKDSKTVFYLAHVGGLEVCRERDFNINGKHYRKLFLGVM